MRADLKSGQKLKDAEQASLLVTTDRDGILHLAGALTVWTLSALPRAPVAQITLDDLVHLDTAGAWALTEARKAGAQLSGASARHAALIETVAKAAPDAAERPAAPGGLRAVLERTGQGVVAAAAYMMQLAEYLGRFIAAFARALRHPSRFPMTSLVYHCSETGLRAVPIVVVMAFLIGVVLTFQGAAQLRQFGAEIFVVDLIAISILRELGILLTAIIVAGRTASALTAAIGSMKMREEIDAMHTLGLDPDMRLVLPRTLALVITLPILGLIAN
ncbi:MAG: ABC transporter permease, partial [Paracoccus sp. (in: a-proteobacteria)]|nr:ABC transporter permease [Paracoccus sp. (in: a-proteobacteria)]